MAVRLQDVTFGLGADTAGLLKAIDMLHKFGAAVSHATQSTQKGAQAQAAALAKQERAVREALQSVLNLNRALRKFDDPAAAQGISRNTQAFMAFTRQMTAGRVNTVQFFRAQDRFRAQLGKTRRSLADLRFDDAQKKGNKFTEMLRDLESASVLAVGPLSGLGARIRAISAILGRSTFAIAGFLAGITAVVVGVSKLISSSIRADQQFERITSILEAASGASAIAGRQFEIIAELSQKLGLDVGVAAEQFAKLSAAAKGTKLEGQGIMDVFTSVTRAGVALKLSNDELTGIFRALQQMMSKGTVQAEELRGQFGERMPGGFKLAADAMGVTTQQLGDMLKKGEVLATDLLPKLAKKLDETFGRGADKGANTIQAAMNRVNTAFFLFSKELDDVLGVSETWKNILNTLARVIKFLADNINQLRGAVGALLGVMLATFGSRILTAVTLLSSAVGFLRKQVIALSLAIALNPIGALATILLRLVAIVAAATAGFALFGGFADRALEKLIEQVSRLESSVNVFKDLGQISRAGFIEMTKSFTDAFEKVEKQLNDNVAQMEKWKNSTIGIIADAVKRIGDYLPIFKTLASLLDVTGNFEKKIKILRVELEKLNAANKKMQKLKIIEPGDDAAGGGKQSALDRVLDKIKKLAIQLDTLRKAEEAYVRGDRSDILRSILERGKGMEDLRKLTQGQIAVVKKVLAEMGFVGKDVADTLGSLHEQVKQGKEFWKDYFRRLKDTPKILRSLGFELGLLEERFQALSAGPKAFQDFEDTLKRQKALERFSKLLGKTNLALEDQQEKLDELAEAYDRVIEAEKRFERIKTAAEDIAGAFESAFSSVAESIVTAFLKGEKAALNWRDIMIAIVGDVYKAMLKFLVLEPLKRGLTEGFGSLLSRAFGGVGGGGTTAVTTNADLGAKGLIIGKNISKFGRGGLINFPTAFPMAGGGMGIAGERGRHSPEAIFPLARDSRGNLGVQAVGGGGNTNIIINIINKTDSEVGVNRQTNAQGRETIDVVIDKAVSRGIRNGGASDKAIAETFGIRPGTAGR